jgi:hypothetical protein
MTRAGSLLVVAVGALGWACAGARAGRAPAEATGQARATAMTARCPMAVPGTQVAAEDAPGGAAVSFRTSPEAVADLRAHVRAMAEMHNAHDQGGHVGMQGGMLHGGTAAGSAGSAGGGAAGMERPPPSRAFVEELLDGARMTVTPDDPADLDRLRATVRAHADRMRETGTCDMGAGPHGMGAGPHG